MKSCLRRKNFFVVLVLTALVGLVAEAATAAPNLVGWWKFDEGSGTIAYDSAGGNDGTIYGATWTTGQIGSALSFDGVNDYVNCGNDESLDITDGITISAWINLKTLPTTENAQIISKGEWNDAYGLMILGTAKARMSLEGVGGVEANTSLSANTWYHLAGTYDGSTISLYINGLLNNSASASGSMVSNARPVWIGREQHSGGRWTPDGTIDDVHIYDRGLSPEEILQIYEKKLWALNPNPADGATRVEPNVVLSWSPGVYAASHDVYFGTGFADVNDAMTSSAEYRGQQDVNSWDPGGLDFNTTYYWRIDEVNEFDYNSPWKGNVWSFTTWVDVTSWWKFDEGSGTTAYDSAGDNDGTIYGAVWTPSQIGSALSFDGADDYVNCGNDESLDITDEITISAWINLKTLPTTENAQIISKGEWNYAYGLMILGTAKARMSLEGVGGVEANTSLSANTWYHLAGTYDGSTISLYINGLLNNSASASGSIASNTNSVWIGREQYSGGRWTPDGLIDDVRIYKRSLSDEEILQIYWKGLSKRALNPNPADGATGVGPNVVLSWSPSVYAASHDVYFGTSWGEVNDADTSTAGIYRSNQPLDANSYNPPEDLEYAMTYYWRIDEANEFDYNSPWKGNVWSFETARPVIELSAMQFEFTAFEDRSNPAEQMLGISNSGGGTLNWEITEDCAWLSVYPTSGSSTGEPNDVALSVDISGLAVGIYDCNLIISDPNAENSPQVITIALFILPYVEGALYVPIEYPTIQAAIDAAVDGNMVVVLPGTYTGPGNRDIDFLGKAITVRSTDPNDPNIVAATIIDCNGTSDHFSNFHRGFHFHSGEDANSVLSGFTITNGYANRGGGIRCWASSPTITNCILSDNGGSGYGGGMYNENSNPTITNCTFTGNKSNVYGGGGMYNKNSNLTITNCTITHNISVGHYYGGGMHNQNSNLTITNCTIAHNIAESEKEGGSGGGISNDSSSLNLTNCTFSNNSSSGSINNAGTGHGGGVCNRNNSNVTLINCTFTNNSASKKGGGVYNFFSSLIVVNCVLWGNTATKEGSQIYHYWSGTATVSFSDVQGGWTGTGNIDADPCFVDTNVSDYHLSEDSPCIDAGDPNYVGGPKETDIDGEPRVMGCRVDIGADEFTIVNAAPVACIVGGDRTVEAGSGCEAKVVLDGSCSSDADSTQGTNDDIEYFDWYEQINPCDPNSDIFLGSGEIIECNLPLGEHTIILEVIDKACAFDSNEVTIIVQDTTPPVLTCPDDIAVSGGFGGAEVTYDPTATDECDANPAVTTDIASGSFFETGVTTVTATATDSSGNSSMCTFDVIVSCFGINEVKIKTDAGKKGDDIKIKGTFNPGVPIDLMIDDVMYTIDDGQDHVFSFLIPAGSFELEGKGDKDKYKFHSPKGSVPDIKAKFDFDKCKFEFKAKKVAGIDEITRTSLEIILQAGANIAQEIVELEVKGKKGEHLEYKRKPKFECCPKCKGIALMEVTSDQGVFVFEPEPGKEKLKANTVVDDGVNGPVKIDTSCSKPLEVGDVFGPYTITGLIKIFDD